MNADELHHRIRTIIHELTAIPPEDISLSHRLREDLNMDSVSSMELLGMLSEELDIDVEIEEALAAHDVAAVVDMARRHLGHAA